MTNDDDRPADPPVVANAADLKTSRALRHAAFLNAAESLFIEKGYERSTLADIVRRSGGSLATLYKLFGDKQGMLQAIAIRWRDQLITRRADLQADLPLSNRQILMAYVQSECEAMRSPRTVALTRMLVSEGLRDRGFAMQIYNDLHLPALRELSDLFAAWTASGVAQIPYPEAAARLFLAIVSGDSMIAILAGVSDGLADEAEIEWRLQPFLAHFAIGP